MVQSAPVIAGPVALLQQLPALRHANGVQVQFAVFVDDECGDYTFLLAIGHGDPGCVVSLARHDAVVDNDVEASLVVDIDVEGSRCRCGVVRSFEGMELLTYRGCALCTPGRGWNAARQFSRIPWLLLLGRS